MSGPSYASVIERDEEKCILCGKYYSHIHHVVHRSSGISKNILNAESNLVCLCSKHHEMVHASPKQWTSKLLSLLEEKYQYNYDSFKAYR